VRGGPEDANAATLPSVSERFTSARLLAGPAITYAALCSSGILTHWVTTLNGTSETYGHFISNFLMPLLHPSPHHLSIVVFDNAAPHAPGHAADQALHLAGAMGLRLPPYHPDLNPIELAFSVIKAYLIREHEAFRQNPNGTIAAAMRSITPAMATGWFRHCGYLY